MRLLPRLGAAGLGHEPLEPLEVELAGLHVEHVASVLPLERRGPEQPAERMHLVLQRGARRGWGVFAPKLVDELVLGDRLVRVEEQEAEQGPLPGSRDRDRLTVAADLQRSLALGSRALPFPDANTGGPGAPA